VTFDAKTLGMLDFDLLRDAGRTHLKLYGELTGDRAADELTESFAFVAADDHLIVDLAHVDRIDDAVAIALFGVVAKRAAVAETVVVSKLNRVSMQLVLHDVDRVSPIVPSIEDAKAILDRRWASRRYRIAAR
jgi:anti-anti-sigma regulatory factor